MGRLALRAGWAAADLEFVHINEVKGGPEAAAHLLTFDSVQGRWSHEARAEENAIRIGDQRIGFSSFSAPGEVPWREAGVDLVLEASGEFRSMAALSPYLDAGVKKVIVAAPVKDGALNVVIGVNDDLYEPGKHHILTAASCTTNCLAPVVKVLHESIGIRHGVITTIHDATNTQVSRGCPAQGPPQSTGGRALADPHDHRKRHRDRPDLPGAARAS